MQIGRVLRRGRRSIQGPLPPRFTDHLQDVLELLLGSPVRLVLALAVQPVWVDAPVVAAEELGQIKALRQKAVNLILGSRLDPIHTVTLGKGDHESETGVFDGRPKVLPCYP